MQYNISIKTREVQRFKPSGALTKRFRDWLNLNLHQGSGSKKLPEPHLNLGFSVGSNQVHAVHKPDCGNTACPALSFSDRGVAQMEACPVRY